jgi:hypothetical protein
MALNEQTPGTATTATATATAREDTAAAQRRREAVAKSYRYLRLAMVGLLVALAVAVFHQTVEQGGFLPSVSAYYYTPAQPVFVGALIALGAAMVALRGTTATEDVTLNIGGLAAIVVAIVPTSRGEDHEAALRACAESDAAQAAADPADPACPTLRALEEATRANVENSFLALLVVVALALVAGFLFLRRDDGRRPAAEQRTGNWALIAGVALWAGGVLAWATSLDRVVELGHYIAAGGLLLSVLVVAVLNLNRRQENLAPRTRPAGAAGRAARAMVAPRRVFFYSWIAAALLLVALVSVGVALLGVTTVFLVEIVVALLFAVFWVVQTLELESIPSAAADG